MFKCLVTKRAGSTKAKWSHTLDLLTRALSQVHYDLDLAYKYAQWGETSSVLDDDLLLFILLFFKKKKNWVDNSYVDHIASKKALKCRGHHEG